jgi:hypothetical protein
MLQRSCPRIPDRPREYALDYTYSFFMQVILSARIVLKGSTTYSPQPAPTLAPWAGLVGTVYRRCYCRVSPCRSELCLHRRRCASTARNLFDGYAHSCGRPYHRDEAAATATDLGNGMVLAILAI